MKGLNRFNHYLGYITFFTYILFKKKKMGYIKVTHEFIKSSKHYFG